MNEQPSASFPAAPRETLCGDRLCVHCMHPLAGRTIEREHSTGLLFVRCGECGAASALFEYPTAAPWVRRFKSVAASTFAIIALAVALGAIALAGIFTGASAGVAADESARAFMDWLEGSDATLRETDYQKGAYSDADTEWLASPAALPALRASRSSMQAALPFGSFIGIGTILLAPVAAVTGIVLMRRNPLERAVLAGLLALIGATIAYLVMLAEDASRRGLGFNPTWNDAIYSLNMPYFALIAGAWFTLVAAVAALSAPALAAAFFRFILPPADRRLVAWLWEWRGKPVPRN